MPDLIGHLPSQKKSKGDSRSVAGMTNKQKKLNWTLRYTQHDVKNETIN